MPVLIFCCFSFEKEISNLEKKKVLLRIHRNLKTFIFEV